MSRQIHIDSVDEKDRDVIMKDLQIKIEGSKFVYDPKPSYIYPIDVGEDYAYIPFAYGRTCAGGPFECPKRDSYKKLMCKFEGFLREEQKEVKTEVIDHLNKYGSTIIAAMPGFGKTAMSIYVATKIKLRVLIITHRIVLINQWKHSIHKFCPKSRVQILSARSKMDDCDFYIMNASNVPKKDVNFFKDIGFLIVDEVPLSCNF